MATFKVQVEDQPLPVNVTAEKIDMQWSDQGGHWLTAEDDEGNVAIIVPMNRLISAVKVEDAG